MAVEANLEKALVKEYENKSPRELASAPVGAIAGVSEGDAKHLADAFGIKTVKDLGTNKYFKVDAAIVALNEVEG